MLEEMIQKIAGNIGCSVEELMNAHATVKESNHAGFIAAGKTDEEANTLCLRMASTTVRKKSMALSRSGLEEYEGVFLSVPRAKDFAELSYKKTAGLLNTLDESGRENLVASGQVMLYTPKGDGGYLRTANPTLVAKQPFEAGQTNQTPVANLPKHTMTLNDGTIFCCVWNNSMPVFPNGNSNYRYGQPRPLSEPERISLFLGRKRGTETAPTLMKVYASGKLSRASFPTLTTGFIAGKPNANGDRLYLKADLSTWNDDANVANMWPNAPHEWDLGSLGITPLEGLDSIESYVGGLGDKEKWDALCAARLEVLHIDPQDRGGFVVTLGDLDYTSLSMPLELWVPKSQERYLDFGVGSTMMVIGQGWMGRDGDGRMSITGWSVIDSLVPTTIEHDDGNEEGEPEGWD
tara:strand:- start:11 stop:1228 length:1218 start_codon:yes stop_codon:yes gene_type:complete